MIGTILSNRYELLEKIGEGGMAEVYKAKCLKLNRYDAVKILKKEFAHDKELVDKFKREATAIANLSDNNIINIFDVGTQGDINYIVMEYVKGKTLKQIIVENVRLSYERAIDIAIQIAKGLDCAHRNNIIHRDVKPQNILVTDDGVVKVTDFGIAKSPTSVTITNSNKIMGSAHYFSPEQAKGSFVDARTDIYSLGIVLYEMVTGKVPFDAESPVSVAVKHIQEQVIPPRHLVPGIPEGLNKLILKAIEKDTVKRYQTIKEMLMDLLRLQKDLNYDIIPSKVDNDFTRVMEPVVINTNGLSEENKAEREKSRGISSGTKKLIVFSLAAVMIVILGAVIGWLYTSKSDGTNPKTSALEDTVNIPNIIGYKLEDAEKAIKSMGLRFVDTGETEQSDLPPGTVTFTFPEVGTAVKLNSEVRVRISAGLPSVKVPSVIDVDIKIAQDIIKNNGLKVGKIEEKYSDTVSAGLVISQDPQVDAEVKKNSEVNLVVSLGIKNVKVPNLIGMTIPEAENVLKNAKLNLGNKTPVETKDSKLVGKIFMQSLEKDSSVKEGTTINISYYIELPKVTVPKLVGKTVAEAKSIIGGLENKIELVLPANAKDTDIISSQSVSEQTQVSQGTKISVTLKNSGKDGGNTNGENNNSDGDKKDDGKNTDKNTDISEEQ